MSHWDFENDNMRKWKELIVIRNENELRKMVQNMNMLSRCEMTDALRQMEKHAWNKKNIEEQDSDIDWFTELIVKDDIENGTISDNTIYLMDARISYDEDDEILHKYLFETIRLYYVEMKGERDTDPSIISLVRCGIENRILTLAQILTLFSLPNFDLRDDVFPRINHPHAIHDASLAMSHVIPILIDTLFEMAKNT